MLLSASISYHVSTPRIDERRYPRRPSLEHLWRLEVSYCLENVRGDIQNNVPLHVESLLKGADAVVNCVAALVLVLLTFRFELFNLVGPIGIGEEACGCV